MTAGNRTQSPSNSAPSPINGKIVELQDLAKHLASVRKRQTVVHCHGVFDLLHIGHIRHLEEARRMGDTLVVTLTPDRFVNKGPNRPAFPEALRAQALAALACVDFVAINHWPNAIQTIELLKPHLYVKGPDYADARKDHTGGINLEEQAVQNVGGKLAITRDITFSSSALLNRHMDVLAPQTREYLQEFTKRHSLDSIIQYLNQTQNLRALVVGETILDEYQYCQAIGKSSKEPVLAVQAKTSEKFAGGVLAVANHLAGFCPKVGLISMLGELNPQDDFIKPKLLPAIDPCFILQPNAPTIVKRRFIDSYFFQKLFEVYEFNDAKLDDETDRQLCEALDQRLADYDLVIVTDFGHGMISPQAVELLCKKAKFLAVNTQSNAGNQGYHAISKYPRADFISLAENEMRLEARNRHGDLEPMIQKVCRQLNCAHAVVTRGSHGCLAFSQSQGFVHVPAVANQVKDRMGAGDTFLAIASLLVKLGAPMDVVGLVGNAAGAQAVATVGHRATLERVPLIKHMECLLK